MPKSVFSSFHSWKMLTLRSVLSVPRIGTVRGTSSLSWNGSSTLRDKIPVTYLASQVKIGSHPAPCNILWYKMLRFPSHLHTNPTKIKKYHCNLHNNVMPQNCIISSYILLMTCIFDILLFSIVCYHLVRCHHNSVMAYLSEIRLILHSLKLWVFSCGGSCPYVQQHPNSEE